MKLKMKLLIIFDGIKWHEQTFSIFPLFDIAFISTFSSIFESKENN